MLYLEEADKKKFNYDSGIVMEVVTTSHESFLKGGKMPGGAH